MEQAAGLSPGADSVDYTIALCLRNLTASGCAGIEPAFSPELS